MQKPARQYEEKRDDFAGILDPAAAARNYRLRRFLPSAALAPFVEHYWLVEWELAQGLSYPAEVLPHPRLNVAFTRARGWITGVTTAKYTYEVKGSGRVLGVMFRPGGFRPFYGRAVAGLMDREVEAETLFPLATEAARVAMMAEQEPVRMIAAVESVLAGAGLPRAEPTVATATEIVELVRTDRGITSVAELARRSGLNERTLQHLFQNHVGVGSKWVIRLYRLIEAAARASAETPPNWTEIAHELGYADQAHFSNEFRRIIGRPPTDYARAVRG